MNHPTASIGYVWNFDATNEKVTKESIDSLPSTFLEGGPETALRDDRRERVKECDYAPHGKYRGGWSRTAYMEMVTYG